MVDPPHRDSTTPSEFYDRKLPLSDPKRNEVLQLWEVQRYGRDSYGDADYVSVYGMRPADWYARGVRLLGRTAVECTRDSLAALIARRVSDVVTRSPLRTRTLVVDPFAGSANTMYWLVRQMPKTRAVGFELDHRIFESTRRNISILELPVEVHQIDYMNGLAGLNVSPDELLVAFIAPPWGDALDEAQGLDLQRTSPPIAAIIDNLLSRFPAPLLCAVQIYEKVTAASLAEAQCQFEWSTTTLFDLNLPGQNHGVLLGTRGWLP